MQNASRAFGFLTGNLSWTHHYFLVFQTPSEMSKKGIRVRYTELMTLLSIFKVTVHREIKEMRNESHGFDFLTQNSSLGELCILNIYKA